MNTELMKEASRLWKAGAKVSMIAAMLGVSEHHLRWRMERRRDLFPLRAKMTKTKWVERNGKLIWVTDAGVPVSLPRVSILARAA